MRIMIRRVVPFYLLPVWILLLCSTVAPCLPLSDYTVIHYTSDNGLPQNSVKAIAPDEYGFIWLATEAGVVRFDGRSFLLFNKYNTNVISSRIINILRSSRHLLAVTDDVFFLELAGGRVTRKLSLEDAPLLYKRGSVRYYLNVWPSWKYGGWKDPFKIDSIRTDLYDGLSVEAIQDKGLLFWFRNGKFLAASRLPFMKELNTLCDIGNAFYYLPVRPRSWNQVTRIRPGKTDTVHFTGDLIREPVTGEVAWCNNPAARQAFVYANRKLYRVFPQTDGNLGTELLLSGFDLQGKRITSGYYDTANQRLFLGSSYNGLFVFTRRNFVTRTASLSGNYDNVFYHQIALDSTSVLTTKAVSFSSVSPGFRRYPQLKFMEKLIGNTMLRDRKGNIWVSGSHALYKYDAGLRQMPGEWRFDAQPTELEEVGTEIWVGTRNKGLYSIDPLQPARAPQRLLSTAEYITCIEKESDRTVWIASDRRLYRYDRLARQADTVHAMDYKGVRSIHCLGNNEVWLCTYEDGLNLLWNGKLTRFPSDRNKHLNSVHVMVTDKNGYCWLSTNHGIFQFQKKDLLDYARNPQTPPFYLQYNKNSGFHSNEFNGGGNAVAVRLPNGFLAFSSMDGIVCFEPDKIRPELPAEPLIIDRVELGGQALALSDTIHLPRNFMSLHIRVATAYFGNPDNLVLEYKLNNAAWLPLENEKVIFNDLPAGQHQLWVRKRSGFGNRFTYCRLILQVPHAFWETWLFRCLVLLIGGLVIWGLLRLRLKYLKRKNHYLELTVAERTADLKDIIQALKASEKQLENQLDFHEKLNKHMSHDIRTPLRYLVLAARYVVDKVRQKELPASGEAEGILHSAEKIYQFTEKITHYLKARTRQEQVAGEVNIHKLVLQKEAIFDLAARAGHTQIRNEVPPDFCLLTYPDLFDVLLHNLLDNAIKNTPGGTVRITAGSRKGRKWIRVEDNGSGFSEASMQYYNEYLNGKTELHKGYKGFGFVFIRDILPLLKLELTISAGPAGGAVLELIAKGEEQADAPAAT